MSTSIIQFQQTARLTYNSNDRDDRETNKYSAMAESFDGRTGDQTPHELAEEGERRQERGMKGVETVLLRRGFVHAKLPGKTLDEVSVLRGPSTTSRKKCTHGIGKDTTKAACVVSKKHVAHEQTEARKEEHGGHHGPSGACVPRHLGQVLRSNDGSGKGAVRWL